MVVSKKELEAQVYTLATQVVDLTLKLLKVSKDHNEESTVLNRKIWDLQEENKLLRHLVKYGKLHFNVYSTDCDGTSSIRSRIFKSIKKYKEYWEIEAEWADGQFSLELSKPEDLIKEDATFYKE